MQGSVGMTINTTKDPGSDTKPDAAVEPLATTKTQPGLAVAQASSEPDLEARIKVHRVELVALLRELKADRRPGAAEAGDKLKASLSELSHLLKWGVVDGWASLGDKVTQRLETWLSESRRQLAARDGSAKAGQS